MKLTVFFLLVGTLAVSAKGHGQLINLSGKNLPLTQAFKQIQQQSGYDFIYTSELVEKGGTATVSLKNATLHQALDACLSDKPLTYIIEGKTIIIKARPLPAQGSIELSPPIDVHGSIVNEKNEPVAATISVKGSSKITGTDNDGNFLLKGIDPGATLVISGVNIETFEIKVGGRTELQLRAATKVVQGQNVTIEVNTGYQKIPKERATGSFTFLNEEKLDQRIAPDILSKLEGITNGLAFNKDPDGTSNLRIRGESTLFGNPQPLIVVDNFPYSGDISNINPNDVESVTLLKDAAAASIWGVQAGNGVIVITTKKAKLNEPLRVEFNLSTTISEKPNLGYLRPMSTNDYIDLEKYLFSQGYFDAGLADANLPAVSSVVEILNKQRNGVISPTEANSQIDALRGNKWEKDVLKYVYQVPVSQQYQVNLSNGNDKANYYLSAGFDKKSGEVAASGRRRFTLNTYANFRPVKGLELSVGAWMADAANFDHGLSGLPVRSPYTKLVDAQGNLINMPLRRQDFEDTIQQHGFLDWHYYPLATNNIQVDSKSFETRLSANLGYHFKNGLGIQFLYQYQRNDGEDDIYRGPESYFVRDLYNTFAIVDASGNFVGSNFNNQQLGRGLLDVQTNKVAAHYGRATIDYNHSWLRNMVSAVAGVEVNEVLKTGGSQRSWGYDQVTGSSVFPDLFNYYPTYPNMGSAQIASPGAGFSSFGLLDRFRSWFANASYTYNNRYTFSASGRMDGSNYFGVETNKKTIPLWSTGVKWDISKEPFFHLSHVPQLSLRATYGFSGNLDRSIAAVTTIQYKKFPDFTTNLPYAVINNVPNPELRWERVGMLNVALDFSSRKNIVSGTIEYYHKTGKDLIGDALVDPTTGVSMIRGNFSAMVAHGLDVQFTTKNINRTFKWTTTLDFNYVSDRVTDYDPPVYSSQSIINAYSFVYPMVGSPLYSIYSYKWGGLDPATGGPRLILGDTINKAYTTSALSSSSRQDLIYSGRFHPPIFGSLLNNFSWKNWSLAVNVTYKLDYYFRRRALSYYNLYSSWQRGGADYANRWQHPGDELTTDIPSFVYPFNSARDQYYRSSDAIVEPGDHLRLQFVNLAYRLERKKNAGLPFRKMEFSIYVNNVGILWRANKYGIDPDFQTADYPAPRTYSFSIRATF